MYFNKIQNTGMENVFNSFTSNLQIEKTFKYKYNPAIQTNMITF